MIKFFKKNKYVIDRVGVAFFLSTIAFIGISLWYGVKFVNVKMALSYFLKQPLYMTDGAQNLSSGIMAFIIAVLMPVGAVIWTHVEISKVQLSPEKMQVAWYRLITLLIWSIVAIIGIPFITVWAQQPKINVWMDLYIWFALFGIMLLIVYFLSILLDWLQRDKNDSKGLPRTTIFWALVATLLAAFLK